MNNKKTAFLKMPDRSMAPETAILAKGAYPAEGSLARTLLDNCQRVICCDGAADAYIERGGVPVAIVGDCDSLSPDTCARYADRIHRITEQYSNDLTKAVRHCISQGWTEIVIFGATGKRDDHTIGNISLLSDYARETDVCMITDHGIFNFTDSETEFETYPGQQLSLFTIDPHTALSATGVVYPIPKEGLKAWWCGTLNEATGNTVKINTDGRVLIFRKFGSL